MRFIRSVLKIPIAAAMATGGFIAKAAGLIAIVVLWLAIIILRIKEPEERD